MTVSLGKVGVLYGGWSAERDVSVMSGTGVHQALREVGVDAHLFDPAQNSLAELADQKFDRVFIALHGRFGEDGTIQGALELLQLPYTGSGPAASALAMDKIMAKRVWLQQGLSTPVFTTLAGDANPAQAVAGMPYPLIFKPSREGSTVGLTKVNDPGADLVQARDLAAHYDADVLVEQFIAGRELTVAVLGTGQDAQALPVIEIRAPGGNYDYEHKYFSDDTQYLCPAPLSAAVTTKVQALAVQAYRALGCAGWGRVDIMLDAFEQPWLLEVNTSPGMTGHSLVPMAAKAHGMSYSSLCVTILAEASCKVHSPARLDK